MAATSQDQQDKLPGTIFTSRQVRLLKIAVIVMGIVLVVGFVVVIGTIFYQASTLRGSSTSADAPIRKAPLVPRAALSLEQGQGISHIALDGSRMAVHLTGPKGSEIRIIDLTTGAVVSRVRVGGE